MPREADHLLLTRFNLPSGGAESTVRSREGWLEGRVRLFERYCLPSVQRQSDPSVRWLIYFDPDSPAWLRSWIDDTCGDTFAPVFRASVERHELLADAEPLFPSRAPDLITTNLDNDDGLGRDFSRRLRSRGRDGTRTAIYFANGLIKHGSALYLRVDRENAFCSVREPWDDPVTCWAEWHNRLHRIMPVEVVSGDPQWLQVIHGTNVSNRVRGRRVAPAGYLDDFVGIDDTTAPTTSELLQDRLVRMPLREARDGVRAAARRGAVALLGKDGVNRVKARLARADASDPTADNP